MRTVSIGVVLTCCVIFLASCGGPAVNQVGDTISNLSSSLTPSTSQAAPTVPACKTQNANILDAYFAEPVCTQYYLSTGQNQGQWYTADEVDNAANNQNLQIEFVSDALADSRKKCLAFVGTFTLGEAGDNTVLDLSGLILSGLASVFTPANTVRALSAASTAMQGAKQTINSDFYQQMTTLILVQQIQTSYFNAIDAQFPSLPPPTSVMSEFTASYSLDKIEDIHRNCSLPFAVASLQTKASQPTPSSGNSTTTALVTISGPATVGDIVSLTPQGKESGLNPISYEVTDKNLAEIAKGLENLIYKDVTLARLGISTVPGPESDPQATSVEFTIQEVNSDITWSVTPPVPGADGSSPTETVKISGSARSN